MLNVRSEVLDRCENKAEGKNTPYKKIGERWKEMKSQVPRVKIGKHDKH